MYGLQCLIYNLLKNKQVVLRSLIKAAMGASRVLCHWEGTLRKNCSLYLLELASATSLVSFGSIQTLLFPHFNTVAASLFWSLKNAINLYSFNYNNDKVKW